MRLCTCRHRRPRSYCGYIRLYILTRKHPFVSALFTDYPVVGMVVNCRYCASASTNVKKAITGSRITQFCAACKQTWCWESQPYVGNVPAGNIYTPAAILYTGAFPDLEVCNNHEPRLSFGIRATSFNQTIQVTWERHQLSLFQIMKVQQRNLILSGDGIYS